MPTAKLTSKGQITISSEVRTRLGLKTGEFLTEKHARIAKEVSE